MIELYNASLSPINMPFTLLLIIVFIYWILVILGAMDLELEFLPVQGIMHFLNIGEVPFMVVFSIMCLLMWIFSIVSNYYVNPSYSRLMAAGLLIPNIGLSVCMSWLGLQPLKRLFQRFYSDNQESQPIMFRVGKISTQQATPSFGQMMIDSDGPPICINVRTINDTVLYKGDLAIVFDEDKTKGVYFVEAYH